MCVACSATDGDMLAAAHEVLPMTQTASQAAAPAPVHPGSASSSVGRLGAWAAALAPSDIQPGLRERALLQHLSAAGAVRAVRGWAVLDPLPEDLPGVRAGRAGWLELGDRLLGAEGVVAGVVAAWDLATPATSVGELVRATLAANEVAARVGLGAALQGAAAQSRGRTACVAAAVSGALVLGLDGEATSRALALALSLAPAVDPARLGGHGLARVRLLAEACRLGMEAAELARQGATAPLDVLDQGAGPRAPLRVAFTGLGEAWLSQTLSYGLEPVARALAVPVQSVHEILRRHVKAADKRLRVDQVESIEVRTTRAVVELVARVGSSPEAPSAAALPWNLGHAIGLRVATHDNTVAALEPGALAVRAEQVREVAAKVQVVHDPGRTAAAWAHRVEVLAPLFAGLERQELRQVVGALRDDRGGLPFWGTRHLIRFRPERLLARIRRAQPDLATVPLDAWRSRADTELVLHTTRGGHWPERRELAEGSPGWPWADTVERLRARFAGDDDGLKGRADAVLAAGDHEPALQLRSALLD